MRDAAKQMVNNNKNELANVVDTFHKEIVQEVNAQIPELVFTQYFLTFFKTMDTSDLSSPLNLKWIELAGSAYNEVDIVDGKNNILYTVPPLLARPDTDNASFDKIDFNNMAKEYKLRRNRLASDANNFMKTQLHGLGEQVATNDKDELTKRWQSIFLRYEKPTPKQAPSSLKLAVPDHKEDIYDYD